MRRTLCLAGAVVLATVIAARAQDAPANNGGTVSREEYNKLKAEQDATRQEVDALKRALAEERAARAATAPAAAPPPVAPPPAAPAPTAAAPTRPAAPEAPTAEDYDALEKELRSLRETVDRALPGSSIFTIHGDMDVGFTVQRGSKSTFDAGFAPLILIRPTDRILIEAAADIGISTDPDGNSSTSFDLTIANVSYLVNDNLAVGAGLFVVPFGVYHNHFDPPWINKFPDDPLPFGDGGIAPSSELGIYARGAVPIRSMKLTYDAYVTNGPQLNTTDPDAAGSLNFDDFTDLNDNKAVGARIGFLPLPNIEMGYSIEYADTSPSDFEDVRALLQALDINWRQEIAPLYGLLDVRGEWVWSDVGTATYDPTGTLGFGPVRFSNYRQGGYVQVCFRPTKSDNKYLRNTEFVSRYDWLIQPLNAPGGDHEKRVTLGVDYWITPAVVLKAAYQIDDKETGQNQNAFLLQVGVGF
jgi:hypothetical protein